MLAIEDLSLHVGTKPLLHAFTLKLAPGTVTALIGESGAGKSLLALALMQLLPPQIVMDAHSQVWLDGRPIIGLSEAKWCQLRGQALAMVFQEPMTALNPVRTVGAQLTECFINQSLSAAKIQTQVLALLKAVDFDNPRLIAKQYPHQLSGGMRQRVVIAIALAQNPKVLIADEPTTALDASIQADIIALLVRLVRERDMALLLITHDLTLVKQQADAMALLYQGQLIETLDDAHSQNLVHPYALMLKRAVPHFSKRAERLPDLTRDPDISDQGCPFAPSCSLVEPACLTALPANVFLTSGHAVRCRRVGIPLPSLIQRQIQTITQDPIAPPPELTLTNIWAKYDKQKDFALKDVTLTIKPAKTLAIVGQSGSGKSTLARVLSGLLIPKRGELRVDGQLTIDFDAKAWRRFRQQVQWILQDPYSAFDPRWRVDAILAEGVLAMKQPKPTLASLKEAQIALLAQVGIDADALLRYPHEFSGGQRQRIAIARALALKPRVLICDEPTSALDVWAQAQLLNLLKDLQARYQLSYCLISHNLDVVSYLADDILVLKAGQVTQYGPIATVLPQIVDIKSQQ